MSDPIGGRPRTEQHVALGAGPDGRLAATSHDSLATTLTTEDWAGSCTVVARMLRDMLHQRTTRRLAHLNIDTPTFIWAPGEATGMFALEVALDEMAYALGIDPAELHLRNDAAQDPEKHPPWSSRLLAARYRAGAECFGQTRHSPQPGSMRRGNTRARWGIATAAYPVNRSAAAVTARYLPDGTIQVELDSQDLDTGTYTVMTQVAAGAMDIPVGRMHFGLGDMHISKTPMSSGSQSTVSVLPAVQAVGTQVRDVLVATAVAGAGSSLHGLAADEATVADGFLSAHSGTHESVATVIAHHGCPTEMTVKMQPGEGKQKFLIHSLGVVFIEVRIDADPDVVRASRIAGSYGVGRLLSVKTDCSQLMDGIAQGMGTALFEESLLDLRCGRIANNNLAEYRVPANADVPDIDIFVFGEADPHISPLGVGDISEIGITGMPVAIASTVYHTTGQRVRESPITSDKLA